MDLTDNRMNPTDNIMNPTDKNFFPTDKKGGSGALTRELEFPEREFPRSGIKGIPSEFSS